MKTAISIPDTVFASADQLAARLGKSRSQLYTQAISNYLEKHRGDKITQKINEVCDQTDTSLDPVLEKMQFHSLPREDW